MPEPTGSPAWWRDRLWAQLDGRSKDVQRAEDYYNGKHPLPEPPGRLPAKVLRDARKAFRSLTEKGVTNWVCLVADAPAERLEVTGFRFGSAPTVDGQDLAPAPTRPHDGAWRIWQDNALDADSGLVHDNALQTGQSFALVWPRPGGGVDITCEHSAHMVVAYEPGSRRRRAAALKRWLEDDGRWMVTLYLPDGIYKWRQTNARPGYAAANGDPITWEQRQPAGEAWPVPNALGVVPVIEFRANASLRPSPFGGGSPEFARVLPIQDRINKTVFDRLVTAEFQAFRQRWVVGWEPERDETGAPKADALFKASQAFLWTFGGEPSEVKVGEFSQASFDGFIKAVEADVNAMAAISKTPPHYLLGAMVNISGDALTAAESGLAFKTAKHARSFGESWEEVLRLALGVDGDDQADDTAAQILWSDIEHRSWAEQVDAVLKMQALGVPQEELWSRLPGVTPTDVARFRALAAVERLRTAPPAPAAPTPPPPSQNGQEDPTAAAPPAPAPGA